MPQKQENTTLQEQTLRYKILPLFTTKVQICLVPLNLFEIVLEFIPYLQALRYSIDYFTVNWLGQPTPIFSYLDLSFYLTSASALMQQVALNFGLVFMNLYWIIPLTFFLSTKEYSNWGMNVQRFFFILAKNLFFLPLTNMTITLFSPPDNPYHFEYPYSNFLLQIVGLVSFSIFTIFLAAQSFFNFQFLPNSKCYTRLKKSAFTSTFLLGYIVINQVIFTFMPIKSALAVYAITSLLMFVLFIITNQHLNQKHKLIELSLLSVNLLGIGMNSFTFLISYNLSLELFFIMAGFVVATVMKYKTYSLRFQLENINKWPSADIILRYTNNLRYYLSRKDEYLFRVYIHGYMQIHRYKCDHEDCAAKAPFNDYQNKLFGDGHIKKEDEQIFRFENVIKRIYQDGYKLTPINPKLQLQNCIYLYERGEKDQALKNLLVIKFEDLSFDKYYKFNTLKNKIHREMSEVQDLKFIDLVNQLMIKHLEDQIIAKLDKAAIINIQFWSVLNEDHPDFQKLNEVGTARIQIRQEVKETYNKICQIAYSEKVTSLYVQYLQAIQNDEAMFNTILQGVKKSLNLQQKIILQDWANTSQAIMVVSNQQTNYGTIIDINSSCALLFGYQKHEIINHNIKSILGDVDQAIKSFLEQKNEDDYVMTHKNGYMLKVKRASQNYNSMHTGMASIISLTPIHTDYTCSFFVHNETSKIIGITSSAIALAGMELKTLQDGVQYRQFFKVDFLSKSSSVQTQNKSWTLSDLVHQAFELEDTQDRNYRLSFSRLANCNSVDLRLVRHKNRKSRVLQPFETSFQFQIQATIQSFKYFGCHNHLQSYISQFSQLHYAQSLMQANTIPKSYSEGINTLRLKDSIIQIIEQNEDSQVSGMKNKNSKEVDQFENIPRKDEEQIFSNRSAFEEFIYSYSFARSVNLILVITVVGLVCLYIFFYFTFIDHTNSVNILSQQITYRNLIIGAITKQLSFIYTIQQIQQEKSVDNVPRLVSSYNDNLAYMNSIKFNGGSSYNISIEIGNGNVTFESNQYLLSFINYAQILSNAITPAQNISQILQAMGPTQQVAMNYLIENAPTTKQVMMANAYLQQGSTLLTISQYQKIEIIMLIGGIIFFIGITLTMVFSINKINKERINIFQIFLDITEMQIQQFSSKTQKFLTILHVQDDNGEIDVQEQVENARKINSSTFAKKKRFNHINFNKSIYLRLLIIPLFGIGFFLHSFITNYHYLQFQASSYHYFFLTSQADYNFYSGMVQIQKAYLANNTVPTAYSQNYILYYRDYFDLHYDTFGYIDDFHQAFTNTFMLDTCNGTSTIYGSTQIPQSCNLPRLYPNGSYLIFTDMAMKTAYLNNSYTSLSTDYIIGTEVLSKTHRKMSDFLIQAQNTYTQQTLTNLLTALIVWILVINIVGFVYGVPIMKKFVDEINEVKNILSILPISLARELPLATPYFNKIIHNRSCC